MTADTLSTAAGMTVREAAQRYRVGEGKVRSWILAGELRAINTSASLCGRPRWVIPPGALEEFERRRAGHKPPKPARSRQRSFVKDFYPD
jgi:excisionase family DNA binding protein